MIKKRPRNDQEMTKKRPRNDQETTYNNAENAKTIIADHYDEYLNVDAMNNRGI